jgi:hypothetical protein
MYKDSTVESSQIFFGIRANQPYLLSFGLEPTLHRRKVGRVKKILEIPISTWWVFKETPNPERGKINSIATVRTGYTIFTYAPVPLFQM